MIHLHVRIRKSGFMGVSDHSEEDPFEHVNQTADYV